MIHLAAPPAVKTAAASVGLASTTVVGQTDVVGGGGAVDVFAQWGIVGLALMLLGYILRQILGAEAQLVNREFALTLGREAGKAAAREVLEANDRG